MTRIVTIESIDNPYRCSCSNGVHTWYGDEPISNDGQDTAPAPAELLLSAVGTCATITLRMYAKRKQWPVEKIQLELRLEEVKTETGVINKIHEILTITGDISDEQLNRLKSLLPKCPVARIITGQVEILNN
jgi:putative redox protein